MLNLLLGRPGGGKSYEAVAFHVIPAVKAKRLVVTNLPLIVEYFEAVYPGSSDFIVLVDELTVKDIRAKAGVVVKGICHPFSLMCDWVGLHDWRDQSGRGPLYVIDECHFPMPAKGTKPEIPDFLSMHRHYGIDVLLMTQHQSKINRDVANMVQVVYKVSKNFITGFGKSYHRQVYDGTRGNCVSSGKRKYDSSFYGFYKSHTKSATAVDEARPADVRPIWFSKYFIFVYCFSTVFLLYLIFGVDWSMPTEVAPASRSSMPASGVGSSSVVSVPVRSGPVPVSPVSSALPGQSQVAYPSEPAPYDGLDLYISGVAEYTDRGRFVKQVYFEAYQRDQFVADLKLTDLVLAGYQVQVLSDCLVRLRYQSKMVPVICRKSKSDDSAFARVSSVVSKEMAR